MCRAVRGVVVVVNVAAENLYVVNVVLVVLVVVFLAGWDLLCADLTKIVVKKCEPVLTHQGIDLLG